jgi:hypothetical protein
MHGRRGRSPENIYKISCFARVQETALKVPILCVQVQKQACDKHDLAFYPKFKQWCDDYFLIKVVSDCCVASTSSVLH